MISSVSFRHPTATPGSTCSDDSRRPWVLLDILAYTDVDDDEIPRNATSVTAFTSRGATVEVTFLLAHPPAVSSWFVRCSRKTRSAHRPFAARVVRAEGSLLLLRISATSSDDFFVYSAGSGKPPSLHLLPRPYPPALDSNSLMFLNSVAILPRGGDDDIGEGQYLVVFPEPEMQLIGTYIHCSSYVLHVFSSQTERWSAKAAAVDWDDEETDYSNVVSHRGGKVIVVDDDDGDHGSGGRLVVGWVDLWHGVLTCDVLDANPVMRLIQLPPPSPGIMARYDCEMTNAQPCRDVTCSDGCFRFVEMDSHSNYYYDGREITSTAFGWTATIWERPISSWEWAACCTIDSSEITVSDTCSAQLLPDMRCDDEPNKMNFNRVIADSPTLGLRDDDLLHMMCKLKPDDSKAWVLAVDPKNKKIEALALFSDEMKSYFLPSYTPCSPRCKAGACIVSQVQVQ